MGSKQMKDGKFRSPLLKLNEQRVDNRIQILKKGKFFHDIFGEFEISSKVLRSFVKNFQNNVRQIDIAIDYAHENGQKAAGWITDLYLQEQDSELWAEVSWTESAMRSLDDREWRYISAEFMDDYIDNESKKSFGPTLLGAALTNRPFVKGMSPAVELSDPNENTNPKPGDSIMEKELGELRTSNHNLLTENVKTKGELDGWKTLGESAVAVSKKLSDLETENKTLKEANEKAEKEAVTAARTLKFNELMKAGKVTKSQKEFVASLSDDQFEKFAETAQAVDVNNRAQGSGDKGDSGSKSAEDQIIELAEKRAEKDKIDIGEAQSLVLNENPILAKQYNKEA